ncbi:MAG: TetR family transcriptional regulator [Steroidobacteraceae bacterium]
MYQSQRTDRESKGVRRRSGRIARSSVEPGFNARERLLDTAGRLMSDRHSIDVSLSEIARHSGLNSALVKYYFGNKDGLLLALVEREAAAALAGLRELLRLDLPPTEKLRRHIAGVINKFFRTPYLNRLLHSLLDERKAQSRATRQVIKVFVRPLLDLQRELIAQGVAAGELKPIDAELFYVSMLGACDHLFNARYVLRLAGHKGINDAMRERYVEHVCDIFINGMKGRAPT